MSYQLGYTGGYVNHHLTPEHVYAYISTPQDTIMTLDSTFYFFNSAFTNVFVENFTVGADGITYIGTGGMFEIEWKTCGNATDTSEISAAIVKNGTFNAVTGALETGDVCPGSCGGAAMVDIGSATGFGSPHSLCCLELEAGDLLSLAMASSSTTNTFTPLNGCASIHKFH